ncbi:GDP-mannose 4,6-dehydratase [Ligilactobacillus salivarius]|uniref:GDP-mannose 4,6-dehydratase n=1 Tax=Ligilactobacillus salivarius TaxID=1624 RepID=UPI0009DA0CFA|nr:GDP-mannose 4,6-dehydratase [Ligilactobacillus salivarius]MBL1069570.1 GDP-mannose 4,6-dehydratase [Ligilactobacillus salivarius]OQQ79462.1 epimerase [Ligilactobacillus salivarius]
MSKYLITGGAGFIGSNLVEKIVSQGDDVVVVDNLSMGKLENIIHFSKKHVSFYKEDITNFNFMEKLLVSENFDYIVLLGAVASVANSVQDPQETHLINQEANLNIYEIIRKNNLKIKKLLFASSAAVYGDEPTLPKSEESVIRPLTPYAIDKFASEKYALVYGKLYNIPTVATRFFNVYGPKQNPESQYSGVLSIIKDRLVSDKVFTMYGDGNQTRDFTYIDDVIEAMLILLRDPDIKWDVYNVATGKSTSLNEIIKIFEKVANKNLKIKYESKRQGDIENSQADVNKIREKVGFNTKISLEEGLRKYYSKKQN